MKTKAAIAAVFWAAVFGGIAVFQHERYLHRLTGYGPHGPPSEGSIALLDSLDPRNPRLTYRQAMLVGWNKTRPSLNSSSYILHEPAKAPGTIRIGVFGDSLVEGVEAADDDDFPTQLQKRLKVAGYNRVEIVSFGVGGYGLSQAYLMWTFFAESYRLDRTVFLIGKQYYDRDSTFDFIVDNWANIHARYVLKGDEPELLAPVGNSPQSVSCIYHGLKPVWHYLRYDSRMPVIARMLLPYSSESRFNPFYYRFPHKPIEELTPLYRRLLGLASARHPTVLFFDYNMKELYADLIAPGEADVIKPEQSDPHSGLMSAPLGHMSAAGNRIKAEIVYAFLTGRPSVTIPQMALCPLELKKFGSNARPLYQISEGTLFLGGKPVGRLMEHLEGAPQPHFTQPLDLRKRRVAALFHVPSRDTRFVPLDFLPAREENLVLSFTLDGEPVEALLGRAAAPYGIASGLDLRRGSGWKGVGALNRRPWTIRADDQFKELTLRGEGAIGNVRLRLGAHDLLSGSVDPSGRIDFTPVSGGLVEIRALAGQRFDPFKTPKKGIITLENGTPFVGYRMFAMPQPAFDPPIRTPLIR